MAKLFRIITIVTIAALWAITWGVHIIWTNHAPLLLAGLWTIFIGYHFIRIVRETLSNNAYYHSE